MPGTPERRDHVVSYRLTAAEAARIDDAAAAMTPTRTRTDWCRAAALHLAKAKVPAPPPPRRNPARRLPKADARALAAVLASLGKIGSNINQVARVANSTGRLPDAALLKRTAADIATAVAEVRRALEGGADGDQGE